MCISVLSAKYFTMELMGEYVFLQFNQGQIQAREVYDFFFSVSADWSEPMLICISPHNLLSNGVLRVAPVAGPGAGGPDDAVYESPVGFGREYEPHGRIFSIQIHDVKNPNSPTTIKIGGRVIIPEISIHPDIQNDKSANEVMSACGTVFQVHLPNLQANENYAMRLVIEPVELLGLTSPRSLDQFDVKPYKAMWRQDAEIKCPKNCWLEYKGLLEQTRHKKPDLASSALAIEAMIVDQALTITRTKRHRIVIVVPRGCDIYRDNAMGCIVPLGPVSTEDGRLFYEYYGGIEKFWIDDIESLGRGVWHYLMKWAGEPKTKEFMTTALGVQHNNCSLIVDAMVKKGAVILVNKQKGLYQGCPMLEEQLSRILEGIATDQAIVSRFVWAGYRIYYAVEYSYLSHKDRLRFVWEKFKLRTVFWIALVGLIASLPVLFKYLGFLIDKLKVLLSGLP